VAIVLVCSWLEYVICKSGMDDAVLIDRVVIWWGRCGADMRLKILEWIYGVVGCWRLVSIYWRGIYGVLKTYEVSMVFASLFLPVFVCLFEILLW